MLIASNDVWSVLIFKIIYLALIWFGLEASDLYSLKASQDSCLCDKDVKEGIFFILLLARND